MAGPLTTPQQLAEALAGEDPETVPVVVDVRWQLGSGTEANRAEYLAGHVPGATFLDLETGLAGTPDAEGGGRHPMPSLTAATEAFRAAGVCEERPVVLYDDALSLAAARAWWLLAYYGKDDVQVLDGGYAAWRSAGLEVATGPLQADRGNIVLTPGARRLLDADAVDHYLDRHQVVDARPAERFRGEREPVDPVAGHIPGALSLPTLRTVDEHGCFLPSDDLELLLTAAGVQPDRRTAVYCGSGVQACHLALAIEIAEHGHFDPAVYIGSWSDWVSDSDRPVATGS
ncbi:MAG: sulfurtransferase [Ornithinimicrobium sp.]|uniref:sulfurtransferase n=1 Tax=Ornithinimicrobium sp. TaxID=1977084 RepID=UPI003D9B51DF